jgi:hypothetical protein
MTNASNASQLQGGPDASVSERMLEKITGVKGFGLLKEGGPADSPQGK